jgi:hypothetical protein
MQALEECVLLQCTLVGIVPSALQLGGAHIEHPTHVTYMGDPKVLCSFVIFFQLRPVLTFRFYLLS